jgi:hypothetical protein
MKPGAPASITTISGVPSIRRYKIATQWSRKIDLAATTQQGGSFHGVTDMSSTSALTSTSSFIAATQIGPTAADRSARRDVPTASAPPIARKTAESFFDVRLPGRPGDLPVWLTCARSESYCVICGKAILVAFLLAGCSSRPEAPRAPEIDPTEVAAQGMSLYDSNGDGSIDATELEKCPPLKAALASYDANADGKVSAEELSAQLANLYAAGARLASLECFVARGGQPLGGAKVLLRPVSMFGDSLAPAEGQTDEQGNVRPTISRELLPSDMSDLALVYPGLYHVEITHPDATIPERYNTSTELGVEVNPTSRTGTSARFDLKSN